MAIAVIDQVLCDGCESCVEECWRGAIYMENGTAHVYDDRCSGCGLCVPACTNKAITLEEDSE